MHRTTTSRMLTLPLLLAALIASGCEQRGTPDLPLAPELSVASQEVLKKVRGKRPENAAPLATAVIGHTGGTLELGPHRLIVPAGAVRQPTRFSMELIEDGYVAVDLTAAHPSARGNRQNEVGRSGFDEPVLLELNYGLATEPVDPNQLVVAWMRPDGLVQPMPSESDSEKQVVVATLKHFSPYILMTP